MNLKILLFLLFSIPLVADNKSDEPNALMGAGPSAFVGGVNVITGDLVEVIDIMDVKGPSPYRIQETVTRYNSKAYKLGETAQVYKHRNNRVDCTYRNPGRINAILSPEGRGLDWGEFQLKMHLDKNAGITNQGLGVASGQTHPKNIRAFVPKRAEQAEFYFGDGTKKVFKKSFEYSKTEKVDYSYDHELRPNGTKIIARRHKEGEGGFECKAGKQKLWGVTTGGWAVSNKEKGYRQYIFDDGRHAYLETICFDDGPTLKWNDTYQTWYPTRVTTHSPTIDYDWIAIDKAKIPILLSKKRADSRRRNFVYYGHAREAKRKEDKYKVASIKDIALSYKGRGREKVLNRYQFEYEKNLTKITDGNGHVLQVKYNDEKCLRYKKWSNGLGEAFVWGVSEDDKGSLIRDDFYQDNKLILSKAYEYDKLGNVTALSLKGAITAPEASDCYTTHSTYSNDGMNLLLSKKEGGVTTYYRYKPGTNLLISKLVTTSDGINERSFYEYNELTALSLEINDDGTSEDQNSLEGVSTRLIKRIKTNRIGFPEEVVEAYLDLSTGKEKQLKRIVYETTREGWITKESIYDDEDNFCFSCEKKYDKFGRIEWEIDAEGFTKRHKYLASGVRTETVLEDKGEKISFNYDLADRLLEENVDGLSNSFEYDSMDNKTVSRDMFGNVFKCSYDAFGRVIEERQPKVETKSGAVEPILRKSYDPFGNISSETNARGFTTYTNSNIHGKPFSIQYPDGSFEKFSYNIDGTLKEQVYRNGCRTVYEYDDLGRKISEKLLSNSGQLLKRELSIFDRARLRKQIDCQGIVTLYEYDDAGRLVSMVRGNEREEYGFDHLGRKRLTKTWFGEGDDEYTAFIEVHNALDNVIEKRQEDSNGKILSQVQYRYDQKGNVTHEIVGSAVTETTFDALNRPITSVGPEGLVTHFDYQKTTNSLGQTVLLKITTAPSGTMTLETHDALGRAVLIEKISNIGETLSKARLTFDADGNLEERVDEAISGQEVLHTSKVQWEYNSMNQLLLLVESPKTKLQRTTHTTYTLFGEKECVIKPDGVTLHFEYNNYGLLAKHYSRGANQNISYTYGYDPADRLIRVADEINQTVTNRVYDLSGNLTLETLASGIEVKALYDRQGRLANLDFGNKMKAEYHYDAAYLRQITCDVEGKKYSTNYDEYDLSGRVLKRTLPAYCGTLEHSYDLEGRALSINHKRWSESGLSYDLDGNLISKQLSIEGEESEVSYSYDALGQLIEEPSHTYSYDSLHNRLSKDDTPYKSNALNEIIYVGDEQFAYDSCGNLIRRGSTHYHYDALDRLVKVETEGETVSYTYDSFGRRLSRKGMEKGWFEDYEATTLYYYHGDHEIGSSKNGELDDFRFLGNGLGGEIGATVLMWHRGYITIPLHDLSGNVRALLKSQGTLKTTYEYTAFGESKGSSFPNQWLFSSKRYDPVLNLYNFGLRYYAPDLGRWITTDPKSYQEGPNLYAYVQNRPLTLIDPFGASAVSCFNFEKWSEILCASHVAEYSSVEDRDQYLQSKRGTGSEVYDLGYHEDPDYFVGFINGINNSYDECKGHAERISKYGGGCNVHFVHNESHGVVWDLVECALGKLRIRTEPVIKLHDMWDGYFSTASPEGKMLMFCHSQGAIHVRNALLTYPKKYRDRILVVPVAPAVFIDQSLCKDVQHYRVGHFKDLVPLLATPSYLAYARMTTHFVDSLQSGNDHSFSSDSYQKVILNVVSQFLKGDVNF